MSEFLYKMKGPKTLLEMNYEEAAEAFKKTDIVILPVGAVEGHGPHLPLGTDTMQGWDFGRIIQKKLEKKGIEVIVAPTVQFGISAGLMTFPGTITISHETLSALIKEICRSLYAHGGRKFVLLYAHGGNKTTMEVVAPELARELHDSQFMVPDWLAIMHDKYPEILTSDRPGEEGHSGEGETSRQLYTVPELVDMKRAKAFYREKKTTTMERIPRVSKFGGPPFSPNATTGNPLIATAETGEKLYDLICGWIAEAIKVKYA